MIDLSKDAVELFVNPEDEYAVRSYDQRDQNWILAVVSMVLQNLLWVFFDTSHPPSEAE